MMMLTLERMTPTRTRTRKTAAVISASTMQSSSSSLLSSMMTTTTMGSRCPRCHQYPQLTPTAERRTDNATARRRRGDVLHLSPDGGWAARRTALPDRHRAWPPPRRQRRPLVLEDQLVLRHGFVPADRPAPPPAMPMTATELRPKSNKGWPAAGNTIIDDCWTVGDDKEGSGQEQTTTNH